MGCSPWGRWELDMTERPHLHFSLSCVGEGNGNPLQRSCLENPRDGRAWWAAAYGVAQSWTRLSNLAAAAVSSVHGLLQATVLEWLQGTFRTQGLNPRLLRLLCWQAGSLPPGNPDLFKALAESASQGHCNKRHRPRAFILSHSLGRNQGGGVGRPDPSGVGGSVPASPRSLLIPGLWQHRSSLPTASPGVSSESRLPFYKDASQRMKASCQHRTSTDSTGSCSVST